MKKLLFTLFLFVLMAGKSNAQMVTFEYGGSNWSNEGNKDKAVTAVSILGISTVIAVVYLIRKDSKKDSPKRNNEWRIGADVPYTPISNSGLFQYSLINRSQAIPIQYTIHKIFKTACLPARQILQAGRKSEI